MFDRFLIYARARRALSQGQFESALRQVAEPGIAGERRAEQIREKALGGLLERARRRLGEGNLDAATADVDRVLAGEPEFDGAASLRAAIEQRRGRREDRDQAAQELRRQARSLAQAGDLAGARQACGEAAAIRPDDPEQAAIERFIDGRERAVVDDLRGAEAAIRAGDLDGLRRHLTRLQSQAEPPVELPALAERAVALFAAEHLRRLRERGEDRETLDGIARDRAGCPDLLGDRALARALHDLAAQRAAAVQDRVRRAPDDPNALAEAVAAFRAAHPLLGERDPMAALRTGVEALAESCEAREQGDLGRALLRMQDAEKALGEKRLRPVITALQRAHDRAAAALAASRELAAQGQLLAAREQIVQELEEWPMHEPLRRQMDILNQQAADREDRLRRARELAAESRLAEASALLLGLSGDGDEGREARILLKDINGRMDLAAEGLGQVRRAVHGPSSSREGLRHCIARLDEIARIQSDLEGLATLREALQAEIRCLDLLESLSRAVEVADHTAAEAQIGEFQQAKAGMLRADRLEARFLDLADRVLRRADAGVHNARLSEAAAWVGVLQTAATGEPNLESRIRDLDGQIHAQRARAEALLGRLEESGSSGALDDVAELIDEARSVWADCPRLAKVEHRVMAMQSHARAVDEVERLTGAGDVRGAHRKLDAMPPTPGFLRTRIFDIKQGLARAQGLEQGFLLRVDEGGEYLVLRDDSVTIGNVRDGKADLRVLANIAGVHARFKRSLSFHGGMEDRIVAEKGEIFVNGQGVDSAALKSGDRVRLGSAFEFVYTVPGKRSLTAVWHLKAGFQVAGTDKLLLMKDRGRDGRILIGRADDAHIRVPHDEAEVELFSASDGQIRVRYAGKGEIGGKPFSGSHPVTAGALVRCGDTSFVLQPWQG